MPTPSLRTLRRRAAAQGHRVWKVRRTSDLYWEYGPFTLIDNNIVTLRGVDLPELAAFLGRPAGSRKKAA